MSAPNNPQDLHVRAPAPEPTPAPAPAPATPSRVPLEDRQLTPEETESLLRGVMPTEEPEPADNRDDPEQAQMAQEFFQSLPREGQTPPTPTPAPTAPQATPGLPPQLPPQTVQHIAAQPPVQAPPPPTQVPVQVDPQIAALQAQNQLLQAQIQAMMQAQQQYAQPTPQQQRQVQTPPPAPQQQPYGFNVPDQYLAALAHEDPNMRRAALNGLLNGVAETIRNDLRQEIEHRYSAVPSEIQTHLQAHARAQDVQRDMFGTYPELAPHRQYVQAAALQVAGNLGLEAWNADVRDAIAERVAPLVPGLMQRVQQNRAQRYSQQQAFNPPPQFLPPPQAQAGAPALPPAGYAQPITGVHGGPVYVRDAAGNLVPYQPQQQFVAGQQTRPAGRAVDPALQDIWNTLGF